MFRVWQQPPNVYMSFFGLFLSLVSLFQKANSILPNYFSVQIFSSIANFNSSLDRRAPNIEIYKPEKWIVALFIRAKPKTKGIFISGRKINYTVVYLRHERLQLFKRMISIHTNELEGTFTSCC